MNADHREGEQTKQTPTEASNGFLKGMRNRVGKFLKSDLGISTVFSGNLSALTGINVALGNSEAAQMGAFGLGLMVAMTARILLDRRSMTPANKR